MVKKSNQVGVIFDIVNNETGVDAQAVEIHGIRVSTNAIILFKNRDLMMFGQ